mmetsp:Transcript_14898/g.23505  ORF Transcript_14898/g.23505 Transcript_14898/m.23505 type:complete len:89 (+) Transcript_14898:106-372(+)
MISLEEAAQRLNEICSKNKTQCTLSYNNHSAWLKASLRSARKKLIGEALIDEDKENQPLQTDSKKNEMPPPPEKVTKKSKIIAEVRRE